MVIFVLMTTITTTTRLITLVPCTCAQSNYDDVYYYGHNLVFIPIQQVKFGNLYGTIN